MMMSLRRIEGVLCWSNLNVSENFEFDSLGNFEQVKRFENGRCVEMWGF